LRLIEALPDEELALIVGKNEEEIVEFFKLKNIKISEDIAKELKVLKNVDEIR
jgi:predicted transcriptional regulator